MTSVVVSAGRRMLTALGALAAIVAVVVGVPWLLWRLAGWPLPGEMPTPAGIGHALTRGTVSDTVLVKAIASVGWVGWALLCWSLLTETAAMLRGIPAPRGRLTGPFQNLARQLVTSVSLLAVTGASSAAHSRLPATTPQPLVVEVRAPAAVTAPVPRVEVSVSPTSPTITTVSPPPAPTAPRRHTVVHRDSLWRIAECELGDPMRWREVWDLNRGRDFGGVRFTNPNLIYPGWVLDLPTPPAAETASATPPGSEPSASPGPVAETSVPARDAATAMPAPAPTPAATPAPVTATPTTTTTPAEDAPAVTSTTLDTDMTPTTTLMPTEESSAPSPPPVSAESAGRGPVDNQPPVEAPARFPLFAGGVALATALVLLLSRLRRSQARRRPSGHPPHLPPAVTAPTETALRRSGDPDRIQLLLAALRAFAAGLRDSDMPALAAVRAGRDEVEVLVASPAAAVPGGFGADAGHRVFSTEPGLTIASLDGIAGDTVMAWPAIVTAGSVGDDPVLIDVEAAGVLTVDGPEATDTLRRIATELAASPASELIEVLVVGADLDLAGTDRVRHLTSVDEAIDTLIRTAASTRDALTGVGDITTAVARRDHSSEQGWGVTVLINFAELSESQRERLDRSVHPGEGVAAVVLGAPIAGRWSLTAGPTTRLEPHGFDLTPASLTGAVLEEVDALLVDATSGDGAERLLTEEAPSEAVFVPDASEHAPTDEPEVVVRVLGPVDVRGPAPINRQRTVELIAYLALHPGGVPPERLKTAIWPEAEPTQGSFNSAIHRVRLALGVDNEGQPHLPHAVTNQGMYGLGPHVTTDMDQFMDLVRRSRAVSDEETEAGLLRQALSLLRGQVFEGVHGYEWVFTEGTVSEAEATISDAAHRLAQIELGNSDADGATWAAKQGLMAVPGSEPLFRDRMEAAHLNGDPAAVDRIIEELCRYVETLEPLDDLHPDTIALWRRIGRGSRVRDGD